MNEALNIVESFRQQIEECRKLAGGIPKLAKVLGMSPRTLEKWHSGERTPPSKNFADVLSALEMFKARHAKDETKK